VFFPLSVLPDFLQVWVSFNPLAIPIEALRSIGLMGTWPDFALLLQLFAVGCVVALGGAWLFEKSRKGFADVL
jgi:lipopolysaccharide transport system permease protein